MKKNKDELKLRRDAFIFASSFCEIMDKYENKELTDDEFLFNIRAFVPLPMPLPSKRFGNILALALELQKYDIAELIFDNAEDLGLDLDSIILPMDGASEWSLGEVVAYSELGFDKTNPDKKIVKKELSALDRLFVKTNAPTEYRNANFNPIIMDRIKKSIADYLTNMNIIKAMSLYDSNLMDEETLINKIGSNDEKIYTLSNGRIGNILAIALNLNLYKSANVILNNLDRIHIDTDFVSYEHESDKDNDIIDEILDSILTYSVEKLKETVKIISSLGLANSTSLINTIVEENEAFESICKTCGISNDEPGMGTK
jgi:hypothetical protein